jgi:hypothetical protein
MQFLNGEPADSEDVTLARNERDFYKHKCNLLQREYSRLKNDLDELEQTKQGLKNRLHEREKELDAERQKVAQMQTRLQELERSESRQNNSRRVFNENTILEPVSPIRQPPQPAPVQRRAVRPPQSVTSTRRRNVIQNSTADEDEDRRLAQLLQDEEYGT